MSALTTWTFTINLLPFGQALALIFIPYLLAFLLQSHELLCTYVSILMAPQPDPSKQKQVSATSNTPQNTRPPAFGSKRSIIVAILALLTISAVQLRALIQDLSFLQILEHFSVLSSLALVLGYTIGEICDANEYVVYRLSNGEVLQRVMESNGKLHRYLRFLLTLSIASFSFVIVAGLSSGPNQIFCTSIVMTAYVYWLFNLPLGRMSLRRMVRPLYMLYLLFILSAVVALAPKLSKLTKIRSETEQSEFPIALPENLLSFLLAVICPCFSKPLISRLLRFDFYNAMHGAESGIHVEYVPNEPSETSKPEGENTTDGVIRLRSIPLSFPKPYYILGLTTWGFIRIATIISCLTIGFPAKRLYDACALTGLLEFPIIICVVMLSAAKKGEAKMLWNYEEKWVVKPFAAEELEDKPLLGNDDKMYHSITT